MKLEIKAQDPDPEIVADLAEVASRLMAPPEEAAANGLTKLRKIRRRYGKYSTSEDKAEQGIERLRRRLGGAG